MKDKNVVIIGAGISGLSFAFKAIQSGYRPYILENTDRVGGCFDSHRFEDFAVELGAHTCYNSYCGLISIIEKYNLAQSILKREKVSFKVYHDNKIEKITKHLSFLEIFLSLPKIFHAKKNELSVQEYYQAILGKTNYKKILGPSFNAVLSQDAGPFPADSLFKKRERRKDIFRSYTLATGLQTIPEKVAEDQHLILKKNCTIKTITRDGATYNLTLSNGEQLHADSLVLATPVSSAAVLVKNLNPALHRTLSQIETASVESTCVVVKKEKIEHAPFAGLIPTNDNFFSVVSRDVLPHPKYRGFTFHFKPGALKGKEKTAKILQVLKISESDILNSAERERVLPKLGSGHKEFLTQIEHSLVGTNLYLCGNYFQGLAIEDCINRSFSEFDRMTKNGGNHVI